MARQLRVGPALWTKYAAREATRHEHLLEVQTWLAVSPFGIEQHRASVQALTELAVQTDRGILLAQAMIEMLRHQKVVIPLIDVIERVCAEALTRGSRRIYAALTDRLSRSERQRLELLLETREGMRRASRPGCTRTAG